MLNVLFLPSKMNVIDFTDCDNKVCKREKETPDFHAQQNAIGWYPHHVLQNAVDLETEIIEATPSDTTVLDIGGGRKSLLQNEMLRRRNIQRVSVDFEPEALCIKENEDTVIGVNLASIPKRFFRAETLIDALMQERKNVPQIQNKTQQLIHILQKPIHTILLSHILLYLPKHRSKQILELSLRTLPKGGTLWLMDKCKFQFEGIEGLEGNIQGFDELKALAANDPSLSITDELLIPLLTQNEFNSYQAMLLTGDGHSAQMYYLSILDSDHKRVLRYPWASELDEEPVIRVGQWMSMPGYAERVMKVTRL